MRSLSSDYSAKQTKAGLSTHVVVLDSSSSSSDVSHEGSLYCSTSDSVSDSFICKSSESSSEDARHQREIV